MSVTLDVSVYVMGNQESYCSDVYSGNDSPRLLKRYHFTHFMLCLSEHL